MPSNYPGGFYFVYSLNPLYPTVETAPLFDASLN